MPSIRRNQPRKQRVLQVVKELLHYATKEWEPPPFFKWHPVQRASEYGVALLVDEQHLEEAMKAIPGAERVKVEVCFKYAGKKKIKKRSAGVYRTICQIDNWKAESTGTLTQPTYHEAFARAAVDLYKIESPQTRLLISRVEGPQDDYVGLEPTRLQADLFHRICVSMLPEVGQKRFTAHTVRELVTFDPPDAVIEDQHVAMFRWTPDLEDEYVAVIVLYWHRGFIEVLVSAKDKELVRIPVEELSDLHVSLHDAWPMLLQEASQAEEEAVAEAD